VYGVEFVYVCAVFIVYNEYIVNISVIIYYVMFLKYVNDMVMWGLPLPTPRFVYMGGLCVACSFGLG
jgi:hypothetical protein